MFWGGVPVEVFMFFLLFYGKQKHVECYTENHKPDEKNNPHSLSRTDQKRKVLAKTRNKRTLYAYSFSDCLWN